MPELRRLRNKKETLHVQFTLDVSVIFDADKHIKKTIKDLRKSVSGFDYEFIVTDRGTIHRNWLAQQGDIQLITISDKRDLQELKSSMARHSNRLYLEEGEWRYRYEPIAVPAKIEEIRRVLLPKPSDETKILHISSFPDNTRGITEGLKPFGKVETFDWLKELKASNRTDMNEALKWLIISFQPDIIFMEECFTGDVLPDTIKHIKSLMKVGIVNWCGDIRREIPPSMIKMGFVVDWSLMSNRRQVDQLQKMNIDAELLQAGAPIWLYKPVEPDRIKYPEDIIFLGSGGRKYPLSKMRKEIVWSIYGKYGSRFGLYGRGWRKKTYPFVKPFIEPQEDEAIAYSSCKIAVGISAFDWEDYTSARMWKAMASGALYLPHYFKGIEKLFDQQDHVGWWRRPSELMSLITYYLSREDERERVSKAGLAKVRQEHSWTSRMETMLRLVRGRKIKVF